MRTSPSEPRSQNHHHPDAGSPPARHDTAVRAAATAALRRGGRVSSLVTTAAPTLVFVVADGIGGLRAALIATVAAGLLVLGWRLRARRQVKHAVLGALLALLCAATAAGTGQARGFFLLPMLLPAAATAACLLSVLAGRPLAGLVANRIVGGPPDWRSHRPLHRFYTRTTLVISVVSFASLAAQAALYRLSAVAWLGILHILMAPLWAGVTAASIVLSRMAVTRHRYPAAADPAGRAAKDR
ncbi:DUF3159 domain-containing protein [Actinoallomurus rhizosphaericola]|uniref:DUF3159 domain-containing protein n=1 Tax=Actinoallomurus rhizosphaericola TaxID=2952536 RepID=UPI002092FFBD|nr:DUF3159 domain-containing protein [Actinoallomurus rhizosphaericola]MCO5996932.1 DUF3159 domain-containing protein [Actinoallomurus rhizosphaericola]